MVIVEGDYMFNAGYKKEAIDNSFGIEASKLATIKSLVKELQNIYDRIYDVLA